MYRLKIKTYLQVGLWLILLVIKTSYAATSFEVQKKIPILLEITLNEKKLPGIFHCYEDSKGRIWVNEKDLQSWHFPKIQKIPFLYLGKKYYALDWYKFISYRFNKKHLKISITLPACYLPQKTVNLLEYNPNPIRPNHPGVFLNYDITSIKNNRYSNSALMGLGLSNRYGVGINDVLISNNSAQSDSARYRFIRLNTTWTLDQPEKIATWKIGDAITSASNWSGSTRFGGIQYATNFNTQPYFITFPLPSFRGEAVIPSNIQILVNGMINQYKSVEEGTYSIKNIPTVTGAGTINVVSQDLLGRTQVFYLPYYTSPELLKPGLNTYSYEAGFIRKNYGIDNNNYGNFLTTATFQRGLTHTLTAGSHIELLAHQKTIGVSSDYLFKRFGIISLATSGSHSQFGQGWLGSVGFTRQTPIINFGFKSTYMSVNYQQVGLQTGKSGPIGATTTNQIFLGYDMRMLGSLGLGYTMTRLFSIPHAVSNPGPQLYKIGSISYNRNIIPNLSFVISLIKDFHNANNNQGYASLILSLDNLHTLNSYLNYQNKETQPTVLYTRNLPLGDGYGYHLLATNNGINGPGGDVTYQNEIGTYTAKAYRIAHKNYYEADISGAAVYFDNSLFLARRITQSYALIQVPGYKNVRVYYQNQLIGKTNKKGNLLIPEMLPYQENALTIEPRDLPLATRITNVKRKIIPYYRSGSIAKFNVDASSHILLRLIQPNGQFVPIGATVSLDNIYYTVGYDGMLFFPDKENDMIKGQASWNNEECSFEISKSNAQLNGLKATHVICTSEIANHH